MMVVGAETIGGRQGFNFFGQSYIQIIGQFWQSAHIADITSNVECAHEKALNSSVNSEYLRTGIDASYI